MGAPEDLHRANGARNPYGSRHRNRNAPGKGAIAALDLGTNNCRLLVAHAKGEEFEVIDAFSRAVRLGEGVENSNRLTDEAQDRAIKALRICASKIRHHRVKTRRIVATEACRRAINADDFLGRVTRETGLKLDVISAAEEARLAVAGCAPLIDPEAEQLMVFDIGGGSTELIWVDLSGIAPEDRRSAVRALSPSVNGQACATAEAPIADWISVPMGVSTLTDRFDDVAAERDRYRGMAAAFEAALDKFTPYAVPARRAQVNKLQIIGVSGTATTFGAMHLGLKSYNRDKVDGLWLPSARAAEIAARLLSLGPEGRAGHPGIGRGRASLVLSGAAILTTILNAWPVAEMRVADRGLREGMLYGLLRQFG